MFNTVPYNSFPASSELLQKLDAVAKAIDDMPTYTSTDRAFLDEWEVKLPILEEDVSDLNEQKANQITIAQFFNSESSYDVGDLVYYDGLSYRCTNAHEGEWDADDFALTTIANELDTLKSGLTSIVKTATDTVTTNSNGISSTNIDASKHIFRVTAVNGNNTYMVASYRANNSGKLVVRVTGDAGVGSEVTVDITAYYIDV